MKNFKVLSIVCVLASVFLVSCASAPNRVHRMYEPAIAIPDEVVLETNGTIFNTRTDISLFEDITASNVGDILTIMLVEQTSGSKSSDNNLSQNTSVGVGAPTLGQTLRSDIGLDLNSNSSFDGESGSSQSNSLSGSIAVTVSQVLPGGNLLVQGEKWIQINQGHEYIRLRGIVRQRDIGPNNTLYSTQVADARISYSGTGPNENSNAPGWLARLIFSPLKPF